jgi:N-acetylneuraminic acid mutarotase
MIAKVALVRVAVGTIFASVLGLMALLAQAQSLNGAKLSPSSNTSRFTDSANTEAKSVSSVEAASTCLSWTHLAKVPTGGFYGGTATSDGTFAYVGGGLGSGGASSYFNRFDPVKGLWASLAGMPDNNSYASAVYSPINHKVYVFGGVINMVGLNNTRIYNIATNQWSAGTAMPAPRDSMAAGYYNGRIYLVGGFVGTTAQSQFWEYDPITDSWNTSLPPIPVAVARAGFGIINGHFYIAGGNNADPRRLYDYDIAANTWTRRADLLMSYGSGSAVLDGQLRVLNGQSYDPISDTWSAFAPVQGFYGPPENPTVTAVGMALLTFGGTRFAGMFGQVVSYETCMSGCLPTCAPGFWRPRSSFPKAVEAPAVATDGHYVYSAGGLVAGSSSSGFYRYEVRGDSWTTLPSLPVGLDSARGAYAGNTKSFYVFGGKNNSNVLATTYRYNPGSNTWTTAAAMPAPRYLPNVAYHSGNGKIYVIGGIDSSSNETNQTWEYDPVTDAWDTTRAAGPVPLAGSGTTIVGRFIYLVGSWNGGVGSSLHNRYDILNNTWVGLAPAPVSVFNPAAAAVGGRTYLMGCPPAPFRSTYLYDLGSNSWATGPLATLPHALAAEVAVTGRIIIIGGTDGSATDSSNLESLDISCSDCPAAFSESFDAITPPALPNGWTATNAQGPDPLWTTSSTNPDNSNNAYSTAPDSVSDKRLDTPGIAIGSASALVSFRSWFSLGGGAYISSSPAHDGGVLEISSPNINAGIFTDVTDAAVGGSFLNCGYAEVIASGFVSPIAGRRAWGSYSGTDLLGSSAHWVDVLADLGPNLAGQPFKLRFRLASDNNSDTGRWQIDSVVVKPSSCPPVLLSAVSRKIHAGSGAFDIALPLTGAPGIECREGSPGGTHQVVLTFAGSITFSAASLTAGTGSVMASVNGPSVTIDLTGVTNAQTIALKLANADDGANHGDVLLPISFLSGDINGNGAVTSTDLAQAKSQVGQPLTNANFRSDINANGAISATDVSAVKVQSGTALP